MQEDLRIIDANLNRAREGLRVIEDILRFIFNQKKNSQRLKRIRHRLDKITQKLYPRLIRDRNSQKDFGAKTKEKGKKNLKEIIISNFRRVEESLRVLEEFSGLISEEARNQFKSLRFKIYNLEKETVGEILEELSVK